MDAFLFESWRALSRRFGGRASPAVSRSVPALSVTVWLLLAVASFGLLGASPAAAGCTQNGTTENCSGNLSGFWNFNTVFGH